MCCREHIIQLIFTRLTPTILSTRCTRTQLTNATRRGFEVEVPNCPSHHQTRLQVGHRLPCTHTRPKRERCKRSIRLFKRSFVSREPPLWSKPKRLREILWVVMKRVNTHPDLCSRWDNMTINYKRRV